MQIRLITESDVHRLLPMAECIDLMAETFRTLAKCGAENPLRSLLRFPDGSGVLGMMPAYLDSPQTTGIKVVTVMPGNHGTRYASHQGLVLLFELQHGCPVAMVDASSITAIRTAAVSAVATRLLARQDATRLAILGSGVQAQTHLEVMLQVRDISNVRVWSRSRENAVSFVAREGGKHDVPIAVAETAEEVVAEADIVCAVTSARTPILNGAWLKPGAHINAVGACFPTARELDTEAVAQSRLFADLRESTLNEAGDFLIPKQEGAIGDEHILAELGQLLLEQEKGRTSDSDITLFKSLGLAVEDLAAAHYIYQQAEKSDSGTIFDFKGDRT